MAWQLSDECADCLITSFVRILVEPSLASVNRQHLVLESTVGVMIALGQFGKQIFFPEWLPAEWLSAAFLFSGCRGVTEEMMVADATSFSFASCSKDGFKLSCSKD